MYRLIPFDYPYRVNGYRRLMIDSRDTRRIKMAIPDRMSFATAFGESTKRKEAFFANVVLETWYDNDGHYGFINNPFTDSGVNSLNDKKQLIVVDGSKDEALTNHDESLVACRLVSPQEGSVNATIHGRTTDALRTTDKLIMVQ
jgi:hypothetical protein